MDPFGNVSLGGKQILAGSQCAYPASLKIPWSENSNEPPTINGWLEDSSYEATPIQGLDYFDALFDYFTVPNDPATYSNQILYFFPGLASSDAIAQPVLSWGNNGFYGGNYWSLAAWYYISGSSSYYYSPPFTVGVGDQISGIIKMTGVESCPWPLTGTCYEWSVIAYDTWMGEEGVENFVTPEQYTQAYPAVQEVYNLSECSELSGTPSDTFYYVQLDQAGPYWNSFNDVTDPAAWGSYAGSGLSPQCSYGIQNWVGGQGDESALIWAN